MADSIYINDFGEIEKLLQEHKTQKSRNEQRISFVCSKCGKKTQMALGRFLFRDDLLCKECNIRHNYFKKTGYEHPLKNPELIAKRKRTNLMKYGYENPSSNPEIIKKAKQTKLSKYGDECFNNREKSKKTCLEKYGVEHTTQSEEVKEKVKRTNLERYGAPCALQNEDVREKGRQTNLKKRGVEYACQSKEVIDKRKKNYLEKTGYENPLQNPEVLKKVQATNLDRYGNVCPLHGKEIEEKIRKKNLERYGVECNLQSEDTKEKIRKTCLEKYGYESATQSPIVQEKMKKTCKERYGVEHLFQREDFKDKARKTMTERYGEEHPMHIDPIKEKVRDSILSSRKKRRNSEKNQARIRDAITAARLSILGYELIDGEFVYSVKCNTCGHEFKYSEFKHSEFYTKHPYCKECSKQGTSLQETELYEYIKSITDQEIIRRYRKLIPPKEVDIYIPGLKLAFEYDGLFYHNNKDNSCKFFECAKKGVRLIQINEHEWLFNREKIESFLRNLLHHNQTKVYARNCVFREIEESEYRKFAEVYHLYGYVEAKFVYGLFHGKELVEVIGLNGTDGLYELVCICSKSDIVVVGGISKLIHNFRKTHSGKIVSLCDVAKFSGKSLLDCGFKLSRTMAPNFRMYSNNEEISDIDNTMKAGYYKIFDYGKHELVLE